MSCRVVQLTRTLLNEEITEEFFDLGHLMESAPHLSGIMPWEIQTIMVQTWRNQKEKRSCFFPVTSYPSCAEPALDNDYERASYALGEIQKLYTIERISKENGLNFAELQVGLRQIIPDVS